MEFEQFIKGNFGRYIPSSDEGFSVRSTAVPRLVYEIARAGGDFYYIRTKVHAQMYEVVKYTEEEKETIKNEGSMLIGHLFKTRSFCYGYTANWGHAFRLLMDKMIINDLDISHLPGALEGDFHIDFNDSEIRGEILTKPRNFVFNFKCEESSDFLRHIKGVVEKGCKITKIYAGIMSVQMAHEISNQVDYKIKLDYAYNFTCYFPIFEKIEGKIYARTFEELVEKYPYPNLKDERSEEKLTFGIYDWDEQKVRRLKSQEIAEIRSRIVEPEDFFEACLKNNSDQKHFLEIMNNAHFFQNMADGFSKPPPHLHPNVFDITTSYCTAGDGQYVMPDGVANCYPMDVILRTKRSELTVSRETQKPRSSCDCGAIHSHEGDGTIFEKSVVRVKYCSDSNELRDFISSNANFLQQTDRIEIIISISNIEILDLSGLTKKFDKIFLKFIESSVRKIFCHPGNTFDLTFDIPYIADRRSSEDFCFHEAVSLSKHIFECDSHVVHIHCSSGNACRIQLNILDFFARKRNIEIAYDNFYHIEEEMFIKRNSFVLPYSNEEIEKIYPLDKIKPKKRWVPRKNYYVAPMIYDRGVCRMISDEEIREMNRTLNPV